MGDLTNKNFGLLIAFLLPGFVTVLGLGCVSDVVATWVFAGGVNGPSVGGFLYLTLASLLAGLTVSTIRWGVIDTIHHRTGIQKPSWDFNRLKRNVDLYNLLNENHYRFYQFYSNMIVALFVVLIARRWPQCAPTSTVDAVDVGCVFLVAVFVLGSRDTFRKFHTRVDHFLRKDDGVSNTPVVSSSKDSATHSTATELGTRKSTSDQTRGPTRTKESGETPANDQPASDMPVEAEAQSDRISDGESAPVSL